MSAKPVVHIIDDDESLRGALESLFRSIDLAARTYSSDSRFPRCAKAGRAWLHRPRCAPAWDERDRFPGTARPSLGIRLPVVLMTGHGDIPMSVRAMKAGAVDFLPKPFRDQDMLDAVAAAIERDRARRAADGEEAACANASPRCRHASSR